MRRSVISKVEYVVDCCTTWSPGPVQAFLFEDAPPAFAQPCAFYEAAELFQTSQWAFDQLRKPRLVSGTRLRAVALFGQRATHATPQRHQRGHAVSSGRSLVGRKPTTPSAVLVFVRGRLFGELESTLATTSNLDGCRPLICNPKMATVAGSLATRWERYALQCD